jgi:hypothetical protein
VRRAAAPTPVSGRFAYKAKHPDELSFAAGDVITLLSPADDAGWAPAPARLCAGPARAQARARARPPLARSTRGLSRWRALVVHRWFLADVGGRRGLVPETHIARGAAGMGVAPAAPAPAPAPAPAAPVGGSVSGGGGAASPTLAGPEGAALRSGSILDDPAFASKPAERDGSCEHVPARPSLAPRPAAACCCPSWHPAPPRCIRWLG